MKFSIFTYLFITIILVLPGITLANESEITVTGTGEVIIEADYATIDITIKTLSDKATEATKSTAEKYQSVISVLKRLGLREEDISTTLFHVDPQHEWERVNAGRKKKLIGFSALHRIRTRVGYVKKVGEVVDAALEAGAYQIGRLDFISSKADSAYQTALEYAVHRAKESAVTIAEANGGELGRLIELTTYEASKALGRSMYDSRSEILVGGETSIETKELIVRVTVIGRWEFVQHN